MIHLVVNITGTITGTITGMPNKVGMIIAMGRPSTITLNLNKDTVVPDRIVPNIIGGDQVPRSS